MKAGRRALRNQSRDGSAAFSIVAAGSLGHIVRSYMNTASAPASSTSWLVYTFLTVVMWGLYGILLHKGQTLFQPATGPKLDINEVRYKSFLFVGLASFLVAVLLPLFLMMGRGSAFSGYTSNGMTWSLIAGIAGAIGAFGVLLAFGTGGKPVVVMSLVFAGAPLVNAAISTLLPPPENGWGSVNPRFWLGVVLAVAGGFLVARFNPGAPVPKKAAHAQSAPATASAPGRA